MQREQTAEARHQEFHQPLPCPDFFRAGMGDDKAGQNEEEINKQKRAAHKGVFADGPGQRKMKQSHKQRADAAPAVERFKSLGRLLFQIMLLTPRCAKFRQFGRENILLSLQ